MRRAWRLPIIFAVDELRDEFGAVLSKLATTAPAQRPPLPDSCSFTLLIHERETHAVHETENSDEESYWMPTAPAYDPEAALVAPLSDDGVGNRDGVAATTTTFPLKSVVAGTLRLHCLLQTPSVLVEPRQPV